MLRSLTLLASTLCLTACHSALPELHSITDTEREAEMKAAYIPAGPARVHARAVLRIPGQESDLSLLFEVRPPATLTLAALDDLGGTLFQAKRKGEVSTLLRASPLLPPDLIQQGILEDLALAFLAPASASLELRARPDQSMVLRGLIPPHEIRYGYADSTPVTDSKLSHASAGRHGRLERSLEVQTWAETPSPYPLRMRIDNHSFGYQLLLKIVEWEAIQ